MKKNTLSLIASTLVTSFALLLASCAAEEPKGAAGGQRNSGNTIGECSQKNQIYNASTEKCEPCPSGSEVINNKCFTPAQKEQQNKCTTRSASFDTETMVCTETIESCLRAEPVGRKVYSDVSRSCIDRLKSLQICAPKGYDERTDKCLETEDSCRQLGQGISNGVCTGTPNLTAQQQQIKNDCTNRGLEYNPTANACRATAQICQQNGQDFDTNTQTCKDKSIWGTLIPALGGILGDLVK